MSKKKNNRRTWVAVANTIIISILTLTIVIGSAGFIYLTSMLATAPKLRVEDFNPKQSSSIFDRDGELIMNVGEELRKNVSYEDLPQVFVDAFVAMEDSRFFVHNGFDLPRFVKAMLINIQTRDFSQGGSTFTMQLVKNTYFVEEGSGGAVKSIERKVKEIYLALQADTKVSKKLVLQNYINKINFGGPARGAQMAAQYYFGKDITDINLSEAALLAGVINRPNDFNPYYDLQAATERRNAVLDMMVYHGYVTELDAQLAKAIKMEDLLIGENAPGDIIPFQSYVDTVIDEVIRLTGKDPYIVPMNIYTSMDRYTQTTLEDIAAGKYPAAKVNINTYLNTASITVENATGEITAIGGGKNYSGQRVFNFATQMKKQPGSSIKPILDYALAFEHLGYTTGHVYEDYPMTYPGSNVFINNYDNKYKGQMVMQKAISDSRNVTAIQTLNEVMNRIGSGKVVEYLNSIGYDINPDLFSVQYGIGGDTFETSPLQMAGAYAMLMNYGVYIEPHTVRRIEFVDGSTPMEFDHQGIQALSPAAAYLGAYMLKDNVDTQWGNYMYILKRGYAVYAKTGTSDWGKAAAAELGFPRYASKDKWMVAATSKYTIATWVGFDKGIKGAATYYSSSISAQNIPGNINKIVLDAVHFNQPNPPALTKPAGVSSMSFINGIYPYVAPIEGMDPKYIGSGMFKSGTASLGTYTPPAIATPATFSFIMDRQSGTFQAQWSPYPDPLMTVMAPGTIEYQDPDYPSNKFVGVRLWDVTWFMGPINYFGYLKVNGTPVQFFTSQLELFDGFLDPNLSFNPSDSIEACGYYAYSTITKYQSSEICVPVTN
jgi:penicillin-binding protein 1A